MNVSVIIPSFNSSATISSCLQSLYNQTRYDLIKEIIVVDDGSGDDTAIVLSGEGSWKGGGEQNRKQEEASHGAKCCANALINQRFTATSPIAGPIDLRARPV